MSDIVERLRAQQFKWEKAGYKCLDGEAADEIKRLRADRDRWTEDYWLAFSERSKLRERLRDVVEIAMEWASAVESNDLEYGYCGPTTEEYREEVADAAGYVRCERCGGCGVLLVSHPRPDLPPCAGELKSEPCDCTHGWRPRDE